MNATEGTRLAGATPHLKEQLLSPSTARGRTDREGQDQSTKARIKSINPNDGLAAFIAALRPDWTADAILAAILDDPRPPAIAGPAAISCALNPDMHHPNSIKHYDVRQPTPTPPSLHCAHGVAAVTEDGRTTGIGCTRCLPPTAPLPRCEHRKPYGIGCGTCSAMPAEVDA